MQFTAPFGKMGKVTAGEDTAKKADGDNANQCV